MAFEFNSEKSNKIKEALKKNDTAENTTISDVEETDTSTETILAGQDEVTKNEKSGSNKQKINKRPPRKIKEDSEESVKAINRIVKKKTLREIDNQPPVEFKQRYNIMLDPSIKKKADTIAKEKNFKSTSSFLNELIKNL